MEDVPPHLSSSESEASRSASAMLPVVYEELRRLAAQRLAQERPGQTLQATALVHEAWLRLASEKDRKWQDPQHFFCAAATAMRRILIENARRKNCPKHGGGLQRVNLEDVAPADQLPSEELLALDEALEKLAAEDADAARLVDLRYFAGLGHQEAARLMGIGRREADGLWAYARSWLFKEMKGTLNLHEANGGSGLAGHASPLPEGR
jgi:RNA polymerase sigma factor (TIGR02999 family)